MAPTEDYEVGADVIVFDDLRRLIPDRAAPITRPHREINPHASTGFGCGTALAYHIDDGDRSKPYGGCYRNEQSYLYRRAIDKVDPNTVARSPLRR